jgi:outer membrane lipoprotein LolB
MTALSRMIVLCGLLSACASQTPLIPEDRDWETHKQQLSALKVWQFSGKVAIATSQSTESARLRWSQLDEESTLRLSGPVGWNQATLVSDGHTLRMQRDGQWQTLDAHDTDALEQQLGWPLPLTLLPWWVRGIPAPSVDVEHAVTEMGRLQQLQQGGWLISYEDYRQEGAYSLPAKMRLSRDGVSSKLILREWTLNKQP